MAIHVQIQTGLNGKLFYEMQHQIFQGNFLIVFFFNS